MIIIQKVFSIFAQNLAYYNEGSIEGGWLDLPQSSKVIDDYLKNVVKVDNTHEEYEIAADAFDEWMDSQEFDESDIEE